VSIKKTDFTKLMKVSLKRYLFMFKKSGLKDSRSFY